MLILGQLPEGSEQNDKVRWYWCTDELMLERNSSAAVSVPQRSLTRFLPAALLLLRVVGEDAET